MKKISIVTPMFNEEEMAPIFLEALDKVLSSIKNYKFEIVAVDDGSKDNTLNVLSTLQEKYTNLVIVKLSRNFGQDYAIAAGLKIASGDAIIPIDSDLQDPVELIPELIKMWEEGYQVVNAHRASRKSDTFFKRNTAGIYYKYLHKISPRTHIPQNVANYRLVDRCVVDEINAMNEANPIFRIQVPFVGYKVGTVDFVREKREKGESKYNLKAMTNLAFSSITSLSSKPLLVSIKLAITFFVLFLISSITELVLFLLQKNGLQISISEISYGAWLIINALLFVTIVILGILSIQSIYISQVADSSKNRPAYIIDKVIRKEDK